MFDSEAKQDTRPQFILEVLPARRMLSATVEDETLVEECLPAVGDFEDQSLEEPVSDGYAEIADGEELMFYTMVGVDDEVPTDELMYTTLEMEVPADGGEVNEDWVGVLDDPIPDDLGEIDGEVVILTFGGSPDEVLQNTAQPGGAQLEQNIAPPPTKASLIARPVVRQAFATSLLSNTDQDFLGSAEDLLV